MHRKEQSGFTPGRYNTTDLILQSRREYQRPLWIAYEDFKAAFDSVDRSTLWLLLRSLGLPEKIVGLMQELYTGTVSSVRAEGTLSNWSEIRSGVRHGCSIAPSLFLPPMDWVLERTEHKGFLCVTLGDEVFTDLDFADDVALLAEILEILILSLNVMRQEVCPFGLEIKWAKMKVLTTVNDPSVTSEVMVAGNAVKIIEKFTYLGRHRTASVEVMPKSSGV